MNQRDQLLDQAEEVGKNNEEKEKEDKESSDDEPKPKKVCVPVEELPEITVTEIACLNISLEEIEDFAKSSDTAAALFASLSDDIMTGLSDQTEMLPYEVLTTILYQIVRCYNILHPDNRVALFDFNMAKSDKDDIEGRIYFNERGNCRRFILPVHTERRVEGLKTEDEHFALIYMDKAGNGHILYADSARFFKFPDERIKNIASILGMPNAAVEKLDPERVQIQTLTNSCGVHVAANCFAFLEYGIQFPRIRVDATNIRQQIVKFVRGSKYVKDKYSIELGVQINWMEPKAIKIPKEFEEIVESQQAPKSSARRARNSVPAPAQQSGICGQSAGNNNASKTLGAGGLPAIQRASKRIRQKRMPVDPPAPEDGISGSVDPALLVSNARVLAQKVMDEVLGGPAPESGIDDVGDLEWLLRNGRLAQFFIAHLLGRLGAPGPEISDSQPISQGDAVDASKVPANEEDLEPASESIGDAQFVREEMLKYLVEKMTELEEIKAFSDYVHRHCLTAVQPTLPMELCRRFVKETKSDTDPKELYQRARLIRPTVELEDMDPVDRARVHFTLSIPVQDYGFLDQLSETGDVDLDNEQRIIKFWSYDGSVKLQGAPVAHPDQGAPNRAGTVSVGAQNAAQGAASVQEVVEHARRTESPVATNEAQHSRLGGQPADASEALRAREGDYVPGLSMSTLPPTQLIPTGMGTRTSSLPPAAQGEQPTSGAPMLGAHTPVAHLDQLVPNRAPPTGTVSVGAQAAAQGAASDQEVARRTGTPVPTNEAQNSRSGGQTAKALRDRGSSPIREDTQGSPSAGAFSTTGGGAPNSEPGENVIPPSGARHELVAPAIELAATTGQQAASGAQNCGSEVSRHGILAPLTQLVGRHAWPEQAEGATSWNIGSQGAPSWNIGSRQAQSYAQSSYEAWILQQSRMAGGFGNGALMAQNFSAPVAPGIPWAPSNAPDEPKPVLAEDVSPEEQKKFQTQLLNAIDGQNLPLGERLVEKIRKAVPEKSIKVSAFTFAVETCINVLSKTERVEEGPSLKTLLILLENAVVSMRAPALAPLRIAIQKLYKASPEEKMLDTETLNCAIMAMVKLIY